MNDNLVCLPSGSIDWNLFEITFQKINVDKWHERRDARIALVPRRDADLLNLNYLLDNVVCLDYVEITAWCDNSGSNYILCMLHRVSSIDLIQDNVGIQFFLFYLRIITRNKFKFFCPHRL
mgnify:CR=1 FL=1